MRGCTAASTALLARTSREGSAREGGWQRRSCAALSTSTAATAGRCLAAPLRQPSSPPHPPPGAHRCRASDSAASGTGGLNPSHCPWHVMPRPGRGRAGAALAPAAAADSSNKRMGAGGWGRAAGRVTVLWCGPGGGDSDRQGAWARWAVAGENSLCSLSPNPHPLSAPSLGRALHTPPPPSCLVSLAPSPVTSSRSARLGSA